MGREFYDKCDVPGCLVRTEAARTNADLVAEEWGKVEVQRSGKHPLQSQLLISIVCPEHQKVVCELLGIKFPPFAEH